MDEASRARGAPAAPAKEEASDMPLLTRLEGAHAELLALCDRLENIADSLPNTMDLRQCRAAAEDLVPVIIRVHRIEEEEIFPKLSAAAATPQLTKTLDRLRTEHCTDECFAEELSDALQRAGDGRIQPETLGYMLRGFFEAMRRHIAFEHERFAVIAGDA